MTFIQTLLLSFCAFAFSVNANDAALYEKEPSKTSSFIRLVNIENHTRELMADGVKVFTAHAGEITPYVPLEKGTYRIEIGDFQLDINVPEKQKLSFFVKNGQINVISQPRNSSQKAATISLFNLSDSLLSLEAGKSKKAVLSDIEFNSVKSRSVNPMKISFHVRGQDNVSVNIPSIVLERGVSSDILVYDGLIDSELLITESEW